MVAHDQRIEEHVIGCMIYEPDCIPEVFEVTKPSHFTRYKPICQKIFDMWQKGEPIDLVSLGPTFQEYKVDVSRITDVISSIATTATVQHYAGQIRDMAAFRSALKVLELMRDTAETKDLNEMREVISKAATRLTRIATVTSDSESMATVKELLPEFYENLDRLYHKGEGVTGIPSGFRDLDKFTAGFQKKDLIIVAARPSVGKTAFMNQLALNMGSKRAKGLIFSLEMGKEALVQRMISTLSNVDLQRIRTGRLIGDDWEKVTMASGTISNLDITIEDQGGLTIPEIRVRARKVQREQGIDFIMIDYLQLIGGEKGQNRYDIVTNAAQEVKNLAKEFDCPVICLSQLSRNVEQRQDKRPIMSDLRESGQIEQAADVITFLHRDDYYDADAAKKGIIEIILAKQRNGPVGTVELVFLKQYGKFVDLDYGHEPPKRETDTRRQWA